MWLKDKKSNKKESQRVKAYGQNLHILISLFASLHCIQMYQEKHSVNLSRGYHSRFHGVMVSTPDSESGDPSSSLGGTFQLSTALMRVQLVC